MPNVLVIGSGGREHALGWKLKQSPHVEKIFFAPGNGGTISIGENISIGINEFHKISELVREKNISLTVVGSEEPLVNGIVDYYYSQHLPQQGHFIFGPTKLAAVIEGSKAFSKSFMLRNKIPTAEFISTRNFNEAVSHLQKCNYPIVIKASGLAAGKGVTICENEKEAITTIEDFLVRKTLGDSGNEIVIEEFLEGEEISILALSDGETVKTFLPAQDHKKIYDGDKGPNTGGMGSYAPVPFVTKEMLDEIHNVILVPTIQGMKNEGREFRGCLFAGLMLTKSGIKVLEFNCRFGDPETQPLMLLLENDLYDLLMSCTNVNYEKQFSEIDLRFSHQSACCVVMVSGGYPGKYEKGKLISGLDDLSTSLRCAQGDDVIFHAGTVIQNSQTSNLSEGVLSDKSQTTTSGGRVLGVTSKASSLQEAISKSYELTSQISFDGMFYRKDIGHRVLK
ncbi:MAG: phosphoribosylamine--glycine ligase [Ignavibacteriales bacterium]|nr:phosphoribosylamine--glycine ligase [Ignavibacteriales bacterium]